MQHGCVLKPIEVLLGVGGSVILPQAKRSEVGGKLFQKNLLSEGRWLLSGGSCRPSALLLFFFGLERNHLPDDLLSDGDGIF